MTIGERIRAIRTATGMTQKQLGERSSMADSAIRKYESEKITPKLETIKKIADALEVPVLTLLGETIQNEKEMLPMDEQKKEYMARMVVNLLADMKCPYYEADDVLNVASDMIVKGYVAHVELPDKQERGLGEMASVFTVFKGGV